MNLEEGGMQLIEHLIPGVAILSVSVPLLLEHSPSTYLLSYSNWMSNKEWLLAGVLICWAFLIGIVNFFISRFLFDYLSKNVLRRILFPILSAQDAQPLLGDTRTINRDYDDAIKAALGSQKAIVKIEVSKRRQIARVLRNSFTPWVLFCFLLLPNSTFAILAFIFLFIVFAVMYVYSEYAIYKECLLRERVKS